MGKVLSFVVLCVLNLTVCRKALEIDYGRTIKVAQFPGLINGDDCCFPIKDPNNWVKCSAMVGLKNSIGKTFFARDFIEMNSRTFLVDYDHPDSLICENGDVIDPHFEEVPFVNFGLVKGLLRSQKEDSDCATVERLTSLGECHTEMVKGLDFIYVPLDYMFKGENRKTLSMNEMGGIPYYIPKWLGGLGMSPGPTFEGKITLEQRMQAKIIYQNYNNCRPKRISTIKTCLLDSKLEEMEETLSKRLDVEFIETNYQTLLLEDGVNSLDIEYENQKAYTSLVEVMWRNLRMEDLKTDLTDDGTPTGIPLYEEPTDYGKREYIKFCNLPISMVISFNDYMSNRKIRKDFISNSKIWRDAYGKVCATNCEPLPWYKIWHEKKRGFLPVILSSAVRDQYLTREILQV